jgi:pyrroline-5-carboxylate reductase
VKICFIGGGNLAQAMLAGLLAEGAAPTDFQVVEPFQATRALLLPLGVILHEHADTIVTPVDLVVLCVKPQVMREALQPLRAKLQETLVVSVAAGIRTQDISRWLGGHERIIRAMPNTPAMIRAGMTGLFATAGANADDCQRIERLITIVQAVVMVTTALMGNGHFWTTGI